MPFLLLLLLYLACLAGHWEKPIYLAGQGQGDALAWASLLTWGSLSLTVVAAQFLAWRIRCRLLVDSQDRDAVLRFYSNCRFYHLLALFGAYALSLYLVGWGWAAQELCSVAAWKALLPGVRSTLLPGAELVLVAPLLVSLVLSWFFFYDAERALYDAAHTHVEVRPFWNRWAYIGFHLRQHLAMVLLPVAMLIFMRGLERLLPDLFDHPWFPAVGGCAVITMIACLPWVLRLVLGLQSLPPGELRDRLLATARRLNFRCSDILLWNTRNGVANALVVGIVPTLRYVVLTDRLLNELSPEEVEAVFGHEAGHVKHHHMVYYLGFWLISVAVLAAGWQSLQLTENPSLETPLFLGSLGAYIFVVFGFLSRRCERQADIYGCRAVSCGEAACTGHEEGLPTSQPRGLCPTGIRTFISALDKVAMLNGISRSRPGWLQSWQHSTIAKRVQFLQDMLGDPTLERRFQRRVALVKWLLMLGLVALLGLLYWNFSIEERPAAGHNGLPSQGATELTHVGDHP